ncbi:VSP [Giardia lamblia P15]|uniref:VSP n=1 Tax=Giardia intestinalis (strain P15) TaxID=658858 RepID=E1F856_GIAIA|nr:VSP [Giardia lamblia P15]
MLLIALLFVSSTLAEACQPDGDHAATCTSAKCEVVGSSEICTQCKTGGVPIDGFCRPVGSPQVITAGCTRGDGTALEQTASTCEKCGSGYFLFMGGCYRTESQAGSEICTAARDGKCTTCKTGGGVFQSPANPMTPGNECVLCSDVTPRDGVMGVASCYTCTAPGGGSGAATCTTCQSGYYKESTECKKCVAGCIDCNAASQCTTCEDGKYLKDGNSCVDPSGCTGANYPDPESRTCKASGIGSCTNCVYNATVNKPQCTACDGGKKVKTAVDGTTTCIDLSSGCEDSNHFKADGDAGCVLCSDTSGDNPAENKGLEGCSACTKQPSNPPICTGCLPGYYDSAPSTFKCKPCDGNCATCGSAGKDKCDTCKPGFFLKVSGTPGECFPCDDTANGGSEGCGVCSSNNGFECTGCKPNYKQTGARSGSVTCTKVCEDETACGGTAGACDATVVDENGTTKHYCSFCGESGKFPIDGKCTNVNAGNDGCANGVCKSCTTGYFLYMGGCYKYDAALGNHMCSTSTAPGVCSTPNPNKQFFVVPEAAATQQSVLACGNPLGTAVGDKTYVGVEGCSQCTAPAQLDAPGMAAATCTACGEGRKPNKSGIGCVACSVENCKHCRVDGVCEECSSGFSLEGAKCVSTGGPNLSTGAIAGISVAAIVVVGGLVGFLCWWFICRGKA